MRRPSADCPRRPSLPAQLHRQHFVKALLLGAAAALLVVLGAAAVVEGPGHGLHALHLHLQRQAGQAAPRPAISPAVTRSECWRVIFVWSGRRGVYLTASHKRYATLAVPPDWQVGLRVHRSLLDPSVRDLVA